MSQEELEKKEQEDFNVGPLSLLTHAVKNNAQVLVGCRNNKKLLGRIKAFDRFAKTLKYFDFRQNFKYCL